MYFPHLLFAFILFTVCPSSPSLSPFAGGVNAQASLPSPLSTNVDDTTTTNTIALSGRITPAQIFSFVYVPFNIPPATTSLYVLQNYSFKGEGNALDLGIFDPRGVDAINSETGFSGSRGWSGGFRSNFTISAYGATEGYNPGPLQPGIWNVVLGPYATNRSGIDWTLDITLSSTPNTSALWSPSCATTSCLQSLAKPTWLRGDFHLHSIYSDGRYLPSQQIANALSQELDFMFFSEHNTDSGNNDIGKWISGEAKERGLFVGRAIEVTTRHGHWQAIGLERGEQVEWRYTNASGDSGFVDAASQVRRAGGLVSVNHPFGSCSRCDWTFEWDWGAVESIEVWNGRWDPQDEAALRFWQEQLVRGERVVVVGGSDAHSYPDLVGLPTSVVRVEGRKGQSEVVEGVRRGEVYLVERKTMSIEFGVEYGQCEQRVEMGGVVGKKDRDHGAMAVFVGKGFEGARACWVTEKGYWRNESISQGKRMEQSVEGLEFVRVEIRNDTDVLLGLTNPVYFD